MAVHYVKGPSGLPPRPDTAKTVTIRHAAKRLGVDREMVEQLARSFRLKAYEVAGSSGEPVILIDLDDVRRVKTLMDDAVPPGQETTPRFSG